MALTCSRLVSMESLGVCSRPSLAGLAAGASFLALTSAGLAEPLGVALAAGLAGGAGARALVGFFLGSAAALVASGAAVFFYTVSLSFSFSASELVKFLSKEEPFVTINF